MNFFYVNDIFRLLRTHQATIRPPPIHSRDRIASE